MNPLIDTRLSKTPRLILIAVLVIGVYTIDDQFGWSLYGLARANLEAGWPHTVAVTFLRYGLWTVLVPLLVAAIVVGPHRSAKALGLDGSPWVAAKMGLIATAILPIAYALTAPISSEPIANAVIRGAILPGIGEEILYRGMLFGLLFRHGDWGFAPAALLGAILFGAGHLYQGNTPGELLGVFGITAIGAIWFSWLYIEWDNNIWMPASFHLLMNMYWAIFDVADNALGGIGLVAIRGVVILISIALTVRHARRRGYFVITRRNLFWHRDASSPL